MTEADLAMLEASLARPLPVRYRRLMADDSPDRADCDDAIALLSDVRPLLGINRELREGEFAEEWKPDWFAIGNSPCGDIFFIDLTGGSPAVHMWCHETHEISQESPDLDSFVAIRNSIST